MDQRCPVHFWRTSWNPNSFSLFSCNSRQRLDFRFWIGPPCKDWGKKKEKEAFVLNTEFVALLLWGNINYGTFQCLSTVKNFPVRDKIRNEGSFATGWFNLWCSLQLSQLPGFHFSKWDFWNWAVFLAMHFKHEPKLSGLFQFPDFVAPLHFWTPKSGKRQPGYAV